MVGFFIGKWRDTVKNNCIDYITEKDFQDYVSRARKSIKASDMNPGTKKRLERYLTSLTFEQYKKEPYSGDIREIFIEPEKRKPDLKLIKG